MASINGNWFHSRSSSNLNELLSVRKLVLESQKPEYIGFNWSGGRYDNPMMYQFASAANIQPSTMQTKIRAMIRYGFLKDIPNCPLVWTRMGSLWDDLYTVGNTDAAKQIYELTLTISLAIYAFNDSQPQYTVNPSNGEMPLKFLLNNLDINHSISLRNFERLVDGTDRRVGNNTSYWKSDLINSGLFQENQDSLVYTGKYQELVQEIRSFSPNPILNDDDWQEIRENPLIEKSPFKNSIQAIFERISQIQNIEEQITDEIFTEPLIDVVSER